MNRFSGTIVESHQQEALSIVKVSLNAAAFEVLLVEGKYSPYHEVGAAVRLSVKETDIIVSRRILQESSLTNKLQGKITEIQSGPLLHRITIRSEDGDVVAMLTAAAFHNLAAKTGDQVYAYLRPHQIMLTRL